MVPPSFHTLNTWKRSLSCSSCLSQSKYQFLSVLAIWSCLLITFFVQPATIEGGNSREEMQQGCADHWSLCRSLYELWICSGCMEAFPGFGAEEGCGLTYVLMWSFWPLCWETDWRGRQGRKQGNQFGGSDNLRAKEGVTPPQWRWSCSWEMVSTISVSGGRNASHSFGKLWFPVNTAWT